MHLTGFNTTLSIENFSTILVKKTELSQILDKAKKNLSWKIESQGCIQADMVNK